MQEPLFGAFLHHFSTTSRQAARIRGAPPEPAAEPAPKYTSELNRGASHPGRVQMKRIDDEHLIFLSFVVNSNHFLASPAPIFIRRLHKLTTETPFKTFRRQFPLLSQKELKLEPFS